MIKEHFFRKKYTVEKVVLRYGIETAIDKEPVVGCLHLSLTGLVGDECADKEHHGGLERALHQYPAEHYLYWQQKYGADYIENMHDHIAGMGENISSLGMTEEFVCLGDRYQWGEAIIEVSQPRSPCFKLNKRWGIETDFC